MVLMISGWLAGIILNITQSVMAIMGGFMLTAGNLSLALAHEPWVGSALAVTTAIAGGLLSLLIAYQALTDWILWNEGTSTSQPGFFKSAFRVGVYGGLGSVLAYSVFRWGFQFATALMVAPIGQVISRIGTMCTIAPGLTVSGIQTGASSVADALVFAIGLLLLALVVAIVAFQMFVRGAELALFVIAAPIVALGWLNPGGGAWTGWFQKLIYLSLATAVQWLCLKGMIASVATSMITSPSGAVPALFIMLAWGYVAYKGPHLMEQWGYRTGIGQGMGQHTRTIISSLGK